MRDLVALSAIPAWWVGRPADQIAESLRDLLVRVLDLDVVHLELQDPEAGRGLAEPRERSGSADDPAPGRSPGDGSLEFPGRPRGSRLVTFPIGLEGELGKIIVSARRPDFPDELDSLLLQLVANQVAVALHHAALLLQREQAEQQLSARAEQQEVAIRLGLRALTGAPLDQLFHETVEAVRDTLRVDFTAILELEPDGKSLLLKAGVGWRPGIVGSARVGADSTSQAGYSLRAGEPVVVDGARAGAAFTDPPLLRHHGVRNGVTVVIHDRTEPYGVLGAHTRASHTFATHDVQFLQLIANLLGVARQRSRAEAEREERLARTAEAHAEAERASRNKSELLAMISHELRTPLNAIAGYVQILEMGLHGPITEEQRADLTRITHSHRYLLGLINNVLTFMKLESGHLQFDIASVPLGAVIGTVEELTRPQMDAKGLLYERYGVESSLQVRADTGKLQQVLLNLLSNATKFTDPGGRVRLTCSADERSVRLRVEDTGCGIPPDKLESVFDPFVQAEDHAGRNRDGIGLGLAISRDFVQAMGGHLCAESEVGKGSTFTVVLQRGT